MKNGPYILIKPPANFPGKWYRSKYAYEHIVEFWKKTGRLPLEDHVVHHVNENKHDNSWDNLEEVKKNAHVSEHVTKRKKPLTHGTLHAYQRYKCRCDLCKSANTQSVQEYRKKYGRKIPRNPNGQGADC